MKPILYILLAAALSLVPAGCGNGAPQAASPDEDSAPEALKETPAAGTQPSEGNPTLTAGGQSFTLTLDDGAAAQELAAMLPLTLDMSELNGNEKYIYLDGSFTTDSHKPGTIHEGDLMLYGSNCIVLFYETFSSGYSYTRLGRLDDPEGLAAALGAGSVTVTIS